MLKNLSGAHACALCGEDADDKGELAVGRKRLACIHESRLSLDHTLHTHGVLCPRPVITHKLLGAPKGNLLLGSLYGAARLFRL
jgi:hypothetical protein